MKKTKLFSFISSLVILISGCNVNSTPEKEYLYMNKTFTVSNDYVSKIDNRHLDKVKEFNGSFDKNKEVNEEKLTLDDYYLNSVLQRHMVNYLHGTISGSQNVYVEILDKVYEGTVKGNIYEVYLPPMEAGGGYKLTVYSDNAKVETTVFIGDVYICSGQSNMEWTMGQCQNAATTKEAIETANNEFVRLLKVKLNGNETPLDKHEGNIKWEKSNPVSVRNFSCAGYQFGKYLYEKTFVPIGLVSVAVGGCTAGFFLSEESVNNIKKKNIPIIDDFSAHWQDMSINVFGASEGYNALIHPLLKHQFRGVLWNQGSSDAVNAAYYAEYMREMIKQYRIDFDLPELFFVLYELNRFGDDYSIRGRVSLAVNEVAKEDDLTCVVSSHDLGEYLDIHPQDKTELSIRASEEAAFTFYGIPREKEHLELEKIEKLENGNLKLYFIGLGDGFIFKNGLSSLQITSDGQWYDHVTEYAIGENYISISAPYEIKGIRYGLVTVDLDNASKMDTQRHVGIYNSFNRPLRMFDIKF